MAGSYVVEQRSGGTGAPWLPAGTWMLAAPTLRLDAGVSITPFGIGLAGTWERTSGGAQHVAAASSLRPPYDYTVFIAGKEVGTWNFAGEMIVSVNISSVNGNSFEGTVRMKPEEGGLDVRGRLLP